MTTDRESLFQSLAERHVEDALSALRNPAATSDAVLEGLALGELAFRISLGERPESDWPEQEEPECICPPELLARGGFKGGCSIHG